MGGVPLDGSTGEFPRVPRQGYLNESYDEGFLSYN